MPTYSERYKVQLKRNAAATADLLLSGFSDIPSVAIKVVGGLTQTFIPCNDHISHSSFTKIASDFLHQHANLADSKYPWKSFSELTKFANGTKLIGTAAMGDGVVSAIICPFKIAGGIVGFVVSPIITAFTAATSDDLDAGIIAIPHEEPNAEMEDLRHENLRLRKELEFKDQIVTGLQAKQEDERHAAQKENAKLQNELEAQKRINAELIDRVKLLEGQQSKLENDNRELQAKNSRLEARLQAQTEEADKKITALQTDVRSLSNTLDTLLKQLKQENIIKVAEHHIKLSDVDAKTDKQNIKTSQAANICLYGILAPRGDKQQHPETVEDDFDVVEIPNQLLSNTAGKETNPTNTPSQHPQ